MSGRHTPDHCTMAATATLFFFVLKVPKVWGFGLMP